jgi:hypothetical protein
LFVPLAPPVELTPVIELLVLLVDPVLPVVAAALDVLATLPEASICESASRISFPIPPPPW